MARIKLIALAVFATVCVSSVASTTALASEGEIINAKEERLIKNRFTGTGGVTKLETSSGVKINCTSAVDHGIFTSKTGGELTVLFKGCTSAGLSCKGGKDESGEAPEGSIYVLLGLTIRRASPTTRLILFTIHRPGSLEAGELELICTGIKIRIKGSYLMSNSNPLEHLSTTHNLETKQSKGTQSATEYENEKGEKIKSTGLAASIEGGEFQAIGIEGERKVAFEEQAQFR